MALQQIIATRGSVSAMVSGVSGKEHMTNLKVAVCYDATNIRLVFQGAPSSIVLPSNITVKAAVWKNGTAYQVLFSGSASLSAASDSYYISDVISGLTLSRGDIIELRTHASVTSGTSMLAHQHLVQVLSDGHEYGTTVTDKTMSGTVTTAASSPSQQLGYTPTAVIGDAVEINGVTGTLAPAAVIAGDSISIGVGDSSHSMGYLAQALYENLIPYVRVGIGGSTGSSATSLLSSMSIYQYIVSKVSHICWEYGVNDLASASTPSQLISFFQNYKTQALTYNSGLKFSISTILPVVNTDNLAIKNDSYWNSTKEANRVSYNNNIRSNYLSIGANFVWEAAGDASGSSGLHKGAEATKDGSLFRTDYGNQNGFSAIGDGLHPARPLLTAAAAGLDTVDFFNLYPVWKPQLIYASVPANGKGITLNFLSKKNSVEALKEITNVTGVTGTVSSVSKQIQFIGKLSDYQLSAVFHNRFSVGQTPVFTIGTSSFIENTLGVKASSGSFTVNTASTYITPVFTGSVLSVDNFNRADTSYDTNPNNTSLGSEWIDFTGNSARIQSNQLELQGNNSRKIYSTLASRLDGAAEIIFDPADFTASSSVPFAFKIGLRWNTSGTDSTAGNTNGIFAYINRASDFSTLNRLSIAISDSATEVSTIGSTTITWTNGTEYRVRLRVTGTASNGDKIVQAQVYNNTTGALLGTVSPNSLTNCSNISGRTVLVSASSSTNNASAAVATSVKVRSFRNVSVTESNTPVIVSGSILPNGKQLDFELADETLPLLPVTSASGFTLHSSSVNPPSITGSFIYNDNYIRSFLDKYASSGTVYTYSYVPSSGNITDSNIIPNEIASLSNQSLVNNSLIVTAVVTGVIFNINPNAISIYESCELSGKAVGILDPPTGVIYSIDSGYGVLINNNYFRASNVTGSVILRSTSIADPAISTTGLVTVSDIPRNSCLNIDIRQISDGFFVRSGNLNKRDFVFTGSNVTIQGQSDSVIYLPTSSVSYLLDTSSYQVIDNKVVRSLIAQNQSNTPSLTLLQSVGQSSNLLSILSSTSGTLVSVNNTGNVIVNTSLTTPSSSSVSTREILGANNTISAAATGITVLGQNNTLNTNSPVDDVVVGFLNIVSGSTINSSNISIGNRNITGGYDSTLIGNSLSAITSSTGNIAIGKNLSVGSDSVLINNAGQNISSGRGLVVIGSRASATGDLSVAIGNQAQSSTSSVSIGRLSSSRGFFQVALGEQADSGLSNGVIAIGYQSSAATGGVGNIAVGNQARIPTSLTNPGVLIGTSNTFSVTPVTTRLFAVGHSNTLNAVEEWVFGSSNTLSSSAGAYVFGSGNTVNTNSALRSIAIGRNNIIGSGTSSAGGIAIGDSNTVSAADVVGDGYAIGKNNTAGALSIAIGNSVTASNSLSISIGTSITNSNADSIVIGRSISSTGTSTVTIGSSFTSGGYLKYYFGGGERNTNATAMSGVLGNDLRFYSTSAGSTHVNAVGQNFSIYPGYSTGNAKSGDFSIFAADTTQSSGTVANSAYTERLKVAANDAVFIYPKDNSSVALKVSARSGSQTGDILQVLGSASVTGILVRVSASGALQAQNYVTQDGTLGATTSTRGLTFKNGIYTSGTISSETSWSSITGSVTGSVNSGYFINGSGTISITLPSSSVIGDTIRVIGKSSATWSVLAPAGIRIRVQSSLSSSGGSITSGTTYDCCTLVSDGVDWYTSSVIGSLTVA